jgi:hypothetical protein
MQDQVDQGVGNGNFKYPSIQERMPRLVLIELINHMVLWLNAFLAKSGVSVILSPCKIVYRHKLDFAKHCRLQGCTARSMMNRHPQTAW